MNKIDLNNTYNINYNKLIDYGFYKDNDIYKYNKLINNNEFIIDISIYNNTFISKVIDLEFNDEYLYNISSINDIYNNIITDIFNKCFDKIVFKFNQTYEVIDYVKSKYNSELEFLWEKYDDNCICRNKRNNKWYMAILTTSKDKFYGDSTDRVEVINLMYDKDKSNEIIDNKFIFPGYHMNKKSWISIILDGSIDIDKIKYLIDNSYNISDKK